jgi:hypothetical protein
VKVASVTLSLAPAQRCTVMLYRAPLDVEEAYLRIDPAMAVRNRPTQDWGAFLSDVSAATSILDRFLSRAQIIQLQGKSYRLRQQRLRHGPGGQRGGAEPGGVPAWPGFSVR